MSYCIENIFPTPIYVTIIENVDEVQSEIDSIFNEIQFVDPAFDEWGKTHKISSSNFTDDLIQSHNLTLFKQTIDTHITTFCKELGFRYRNYNVKSWMTSFAKTEYAHIHTHPQVDMCGVYYYKTNGNDGSLFFETDNHSFRDSLCFGKHSNRWIHAPIVGKLILFPHYLAHGVTTNTTNSIRHSIAFNINFQ